MSARLVLRFDDKTAFAAEYEANIATGGAFVPSEAVFDPREIVELEIALGWCDQRFVEPAEVVFCGPGPNGRPGVALQILSDVVALRERLGPHARLAEGDVAPRRSPRFAARVRARLATSDVEIEGRTRNLSETGVLLSADGSDFPLGKQVDVELMHPESGERVRVRGRVARHVEGEGTVAAVGVAFDDDGGRPSSELVDFVRDVLELEEQRAGSGITGRVEELGMPALLEMLGRSAARGTLTVRHGSEEGTIAFESGQLRFAHLAGLSGQKALSRMLGWARGAFSFVATTDDADAADEPVPLEVAMLDALRRLDEARRFGVPDPRQTFAVDADTRDATPLDGKLEEAVVDLAQAGFTLRRILDVVPEEDAAILDAVRSLTDRSILIPN